MFSLREQRGSIHKPSGERSSLSQLWREFWRESPPWVISLAIHFLILLAMAFLVLNAEYRLRPLNIDSRLSDEKAMEFVEGAGGKPPADLAADALAESVEQAAAMPELHFDSQGGMLEQVEALRAFEITAALSGRSGRLKESLLASAGGNAQSERAVSRGLSWLAKHQFPDGHWSLNVVAPRCRGRCDGWAPFPADAGATGLALLPFLGAGHTHKQRGLYQSNVRLGLKWLLAQQQPNGSLFREGPSNTHMYSHGIATIALCEAYALTLDSALREPAQRAIDYIVEAQIDADGGWRYQPGDRASDTSVVGWQVMALQSARMAGLRVPPGTLHAVSGWLDRVAHSGGRFAYMAGNGPSLAMTAEGLLCRQYLGWPSNHPDLLAGADTLVANLPDWRRRDVYYWYYATQVTHHLGGEHWKAWNARTRDLMVRKQIKAGHEAGSWHPSLPSRDKWNSAGRLYVTTLSLLVLEVYYRHLPLYQELPDTTGG